MLFVGCDCVEVVVVVELLDELGHDVGLAEQVELLSLHLDLRRLSY